MRRAGLLVLLACASAGCFLRGDRPSASAIVRSLAPPLPAEGLLVESVLVEQALGDPFLDRGLWVGSLPVGGPETRALLASAGLMPIAEVGAPFGYRVAFAAVAIPEAAVAEREETVAGPDRSDPAGDGR